MKYLPLVVLTLFIFGCIDGPIINTNNSNSSGLLNNSILLSANLSNETLQPFLSEGCTYDSEYKRLIYCNENATFVQKFNCPTTMHLEPTGSSLSPVLFPLFNCDKLTYNESEDDYDISCGGLGRRCSTYLYWNGNEFTVIRNKAQLTAAIVPISDESEALGYVLLVTGDMDSVKIGDLNTQFANAQKTADGYLVTTYDTTLFGCYDKRDYFEVKSSVSSDGRVQEISRTVVYSEPLDGMICVD